MISSQISAPAAAVTTLAAPRRFCAIHNRLNAATEIKIMTVGEPREVISAMALFSHGDRDFC
jgi:hypothetical protein